MISRKKTGHTDSKKSARKTTKQYPGYQKYSKLDDITRRGKRIDIVDMDAELDSENTPLPKARKIRAEKDDREKMIRKFHGPSEVTSEDLQALGPKNLSMDGGDDEQLRQRKKPVDFAGKDLDVPGAEADDAREAIGSEDEENNLYSLGGDGKENLEERND